MPRLDPAPNAPERWTGEGDEPVHEISINPSYLSERTAQQTASTLVHEMVHLWQQEHGKPGRRNYHNREWAEKMEAVGLVPSSTGMPGGKRTGSRMTHYIPESGPFVDAWASRPEASEQLFPYTCAESAATTARKVASRKSKTKYTCPECGANAWAKPESEIGCWACQVRMDEQVG